MVEDELVEIMARGQYAANHWWRSIDGDDHGDGRYADVGGTRMRAVEWEDLDAAEQESRMEDARAALDALHGRGLAVVPVATRANEVTPIMLKAAWNVARQFWPRQVAEYRPCKACGQLKGLRIVECSRTLTEPLPGFREAIEAAFAVSHQNPGAMRSEAEPVP